MVSGKLDPIMLLHPEGPPSARLLRAILRPEYWVRQILKRLSLGSLEFRFSIQAVDRPQYVFGVMQAIYLAKRLKLGAVSVVEFGVARGDGLLALEKNAIELGNKYGIKVEVYGFDLSSGLPTPSNHTDLPYVWKRGAYKMDVEPLRKRLKVAKLLLGDVAETVLRFNAGDHAPIGFISFDLDYYSSTVNAFRIFDCSDRYILPRVFCYFDDIASDGHQIHCDQVGEMLAIREFNEQQKGACVMAAPSVMRFGTVFPADWQQQMFACHRFMHRDYNTYIGD